MAEYTLSSFARRDLVAAGLYASKRAASIEAGERVIDRLAAVMEKLTEFPTMGRSRAEIRPRLRSFPSNPFIIFYRRTRAGIHVLRILHQRENVRKAFPGRPPRPSSGA